MQWYEYILMFLIMGILLIPFFIRFIPRKGKKKSGCGCGCESCKEDCPMCHKEATQK